MFLKLLTFKLLILTTAISFFQVLADNTLTDKKIEYAMTPVNAFEGKNGFLIVLDGVKLEGVKKTISYILYISQSDITADGNILSATIINETDTSFSYLKLDEQARDLFFRDKNPLEMTLSHLSNRGDVKLVFKDQPLRAYIEQSKSGVSNQSENFILVEQSRLLNLARGITLNTRVYSFDQRLPSKYSPSNSSFKGPFVMLFERSRTARQVEAKSPRDFVLIVLYKSDDGRLLGGRAIEMSLNKTGDKLSPINGDSYFVIPHMSSGFGEHAGSVSASYFLKDLTSGGEEVFRSLGVGIKDLKGRMDERHAARELNPVFSIRSYSFQVVSSGQKIHGPSEAGIEYVALSPEDTLVMINQTLNNSPFLYNYLNGMARPSAVPEITDVVNLRREQVGQPPVGVVETPVGTFLKKLFSPKCLSTVTLGTP